MSKQDQRFEPRAGFQSLIYIDPKDGLASLSNSDFVVTERSYETIRCDSRLAAVTTLNIDAVVERTHAF